MDSYNLVTRRRNAIRSGLACIQCRSRHLKCDGIKPACARCRSDGAVCTYPKSRRSGRKRANAQCAVSVQEISAQPIDFALQHGFPMPMSVSEWLPGISSRDTSSSGSQLEQWTDESQLPDHLIHLFYRFFHKAHPCALPHQFFTPYRSDQAGGIGLLTAVMQYIGSLFTRKIPSEPWKEQVEVLFLGLRHQPCVFEIQALLFYSIVMQWNDERQYSDSLLNMAIDRALALGMNKSTFVTQNADKQPVLAESYRRTWWMLYVSEFSMAAIDRKLQFRLHIRSVECSVDLPCSESEYEAGTVSEPRTLVEFDQREFADEIDTGFSSFSYYIGLYRSLDSCFWGKQRNNEEAVKKICTSADAAISSFRSFCSKTERSLIAKDGTLDTFIFKANMAIVVFTVEVHRYLSTIVYNPVEALSNCGPTPPPEKLGPGFVQEASTHTAKILAETELMIDLLTLPVNLISHSPLTICQIATPTIALISACRHILEGEEQVSARERIRVAIGSMEKFAEVWPRGVTSVKEVKAVAREILGVSKPFLPAVLEIPNRDASDLPISRDSAYESYTFLEGLMTDT